MKQPAPKPVTAASYFLLRCLPVRALTARLLARPPRGTDACEAHRFPPALHPARRCLPEGRMITLDSNPQDDRNRTHIIYLHGGAYMLEATAMHRRFAGILAGRHNLRVSLLFYPLAPQSRCTQTLDRTAVLYSALRCLYGLDRFIFMGDSAGGGLALALMQRLRTLRPGHMPAAGVLFSPWLDLGLNSPLIPSYAHKEAVLPLAGLRRAGQLYAGDLDSQDPRCSPLYGGAGNLGRLLIFVSRHELFYPDCLSFYTRARRAAGTEIELVAEPRRLHCWPLMPPCSEQKNNFRQIAEFCEL